MPFFEVINGAVGIPARIGAAVADDFSAARLYQLALADTAPIAV
jgi:hypothetical protein